MIFFEKKTNRGEVVARNFKDQFLVGKIKEKKFSSNSGTLRLISNDPDLVKSSSVFRKVGDACAIAFDLMHSNFIEQIKAHSHTLKKIQGQLSQKVEGIIPNPILIYTKNYEEQRKIVIESIKSDPDRTADTLIYLQKRIFELGAHMSSFEILHMEEQIDLDLKLHNVRRLIINISHAFKDVFDDIGLKIHFMFEDEVANSNKLQMDYKTINAAFYNFFDNALKYAKPYSEIRFYFFIEDNDIFKLLITMRSLRIEKDELTKIFELGYRGKNCLKEEGSGIGMYVIKKVFELNNFNIEVNPDYGDMEEYDGRQYILNKFVVSGSV